MADHSAASRIALQDVVRAYGLHGANGKCERAAARCPTTAIVSAPVRLPTSTTARSTRSWPALGVPGACISKLLKKDFSFVLVFVAKKTVYGPLCSRSRPQEAKIAMVRWPASEKVLGALGEGEGASDVPDIASSIPLQQHKRSRHISLAGRGCPRLIGGCECQASETKRP